MISWRFILICASMPVVFSSCKHGSSKECDNIHIDTTSTLYAFYPCYRDIRWICGDCPDKDNDSILFCCTAAFSKDYSVKTSHDKICGPHMDSGKFYEGYQHQLMNGAFIYSDGEYSFVHDALRDKIRMYEGSSSTFGFCQMRLDTAIVSIPSDSIYFEKFGLRGYRNLEGRLRLSMTKFKYRALCEKKRKLCVVESKEDVTLTQFRKNLEEYGVTHALYLDTGIGWSYSWYRDNRGEVQTLHPYIHPFNTNWLVFYKYQIKTNR